MAGESSDALGRAKLLRWIARRQRGIDNAEDLLHEAFVRYEQYRRSASIADPAAFLLHAAANLAIDQHRIRRRLASEPVEVFCIDLPDPAPQASEILASRERLDRVLLGLDALSTRTREIFLLHRLDGYKQRDIANRLGISRSAVEKHIAKAAAFLAAWIEDW